MTTVFHVDMDAFFVSVEQLFDPTLIGKPVVVGGQANQRGVVSAASYEARKFGIHSAMPLRTAYQLCPHAVFVDGHMERYQDMSHQVFEILNCFSPKVEMASIDEAYLDLTGTERLHGAPLKAAHELHQRMKRDTGLNCSIGIATSRLVAKVASDQAKPNGVLWVVPGEEADFLAPLDIRRIPGVGKKTEAKLNEIGIKRVGDLAKLDEAFLDERFGKWGLALAGKAHGLDAGGFFDHSIAEERSPKSISHEHTFDTDTTDTELLEATLAKLSEKVGRRLRDHGMHAKVMHIKFRYSDFSTFTRAHTFDHGTQLDIDLIEVARELFRANWNGQPIRLVGVYTGALKHDEGQLNMLEKERNERWRKALDAVDRVREKFGSESVELAAGMGGMYRQKVHENPENLPGRAPGKRPPEQPKRSADPDDG